MTGGLSASKSKGNPFQNSDILFKVRTNLSIQDQTELRSSCPAINQVYKENIVDNYINGLTNKNRNIDRKTLNDIIKLATPTQLKSIITNVLNHAQNSETGREEIAGTIATIAKTAKGRNALINNSAIQTLATLAKEKNSEFGQTWIAIAIATIAITDKERSALINNGAIQTLTTLAEKDNSEDGRAWIAVAIATIAKSGEVLSNFITNGGIHALTTLSRKNNSEDGRKEIAKTITTIACSAEGRSALVRFKNRENGNIIQTLSLIHI